MKEKQDYIQDIAEIRSMMERSSKFLSLSGWAGIMAGIYALLGAGIAYEFFYFNPDRIFYEHPDFRNVIVLAVLVLVLAVGTAIVLSYFKSSKKGEGVWNPASRQLLVNMAVPLAAGGIFLLVILSDNLTGLIAPLTLLFYGLALFAAGKFTYAEVKYLGIIQMVLGLIGSIFIEYSLLLWATGFGAAHIIYGIYMHFRYER